MFGDEYDDFGPLPMPDFHADSPPPMAELESIAEEMPQKEQDEIQMPDKKRRKIDVSFVEKHLSVKHSSEVLKALALVVCSLKVHILHFSIFYTHFYDYLVFFIVSALKIILETYTSTSKMARKMKKIRKTREELRFLSFLAPITSVSL